MNMEILKFFKSITAKLKKPNILGGRNFYRDWKIVGVIGIVLVLLEVAVIWYWSARVIGSEAEIKAGSRAVLTIDRGALGEVVDFYKNQEKLFEETKYTPVGVSDPSR